MRHIGLIILLTTIYMAPKGAMVSSGAFILLYKSSLSLLCGSLAIKYFGKSKLTKAIFYIEIMAIIPQITLAFTPYAHDMHRYIFDFIDWAYHNYKQIPFWLYLAELLLVGLSFVGLERFKKYINYSINFIRNRFNGYRNVRWVG